jgi:glutamate--cysteine ligase
LAKSTERAPVLTGFRDLVAHLEKGPKPDRSKWRVGTEHEKFAFYRDTLAPVPYEGERGIGALLDALADKYGWARVKEGANTIALKQDDASITLEPGGQFELSGAPLQHLHQTCAETGSHLSQLRDVAGAMGIAFLGVGFSPLWSLEETPIMPKGRYQIMRAYMAKVGRLGRQMMFRSCTVQTNLDFGSEADMVKKFRVGLALQPIATALFAASPFAEARLNGFLSYRAHVWTDTDPDRTGMLPWVFEEGMGFERYARYALDVPMYFVYRDGKYIDASGQSFRAFMEGRLPALPGERPTEKDWEDHLTTIFPEVRLKTYLEMRGADAGPWSRLCALPAFWAGILYDDAALEAAWSLVKSWTAEDRESLRRAVPVLGLRAPIRGNSARDIAQAALAIARQGLKSRARTDNSGEDETHFLGELDDIAATGVTPAERLIERYRTEWGGDVRRVFEACAY